MSLPTITLDSVWHIGTLNPADKRRRYRSSYEGAGLSVSVDPDAWNRIARLGGNPWHELTKRGGIHLLDRYRLSDRAVADITDWARQKGLVTDALVWQIDTCTHEDTCDQPCGVITLPDEPGAAAEAEATAEESAYTYDDQPLEALYRRVPALAATPALTDRVGHRVEPSVVLDMLIVEYANHVLHLDGVWWNEPLDPESLSAPRGVIHAHLVPTLTTVQTLPAPRR